MEFKKANTWIAVVAIALAAMVTIASSADARTSMTVTIRHQTLGCHAWSTSASGPFRASLKVNLDRGSRLTFVNNDVMPHRLVQLSGPKVTLVKANMNHMAARASSTFTRAGTYVFTTRAGEDYKWAHGMTTKGEDNVLRLKVVVS